MAHTLKLMPVALAVTGGEKAQGLFEVNRQAEDKTGLHRYQIIQVVRGDRIAEFRRDMGLASKWRGVQQINIPSLMEHTVDELIDLADALRGEREIDLYEWLELDKMNLA